MTDVVKRLRERMDEPLISQDGEESTEVLVDRAKLAALLDALGGGE